MTFIFEFDSILIEYLMTFLIVIVFLQLGYIIHQWNKIQELREALFRDKNDLEDTKAEYEDFKGFTKHNDHKVIER